MSVRMTEVAPQTPSGAANISVEVEDIAPEASFDANLELIAERPIERPIESPDFTRVGQILRETLPLDIQMEGGAAQPPVIDETAVQTHSIDVEQPIGKPVIAKRSPEATPQIDVSESLVRARILPIRETDVEARSAELIPLKTANISKIQQPTSTVSTAENPSILGISIATTLQSNQQEARQPNGLMLDRKPDKNPRIAPVEISSPQSSTPVQPDIVREKLPELKLQIGGESQLDVNELGSIFSDKQQLQRPLPSIIPVVQPTASRPQTAEAKILSQISAAILNTSKDTVEIRLDPPELGRVTISITQGESGLSATVTSEKPEIADLLRRHAELLSRELSKSGFSEASLEFSHRDPRQDQSAFESDNGRFLSASSEQTEANSTIEMILRSQSGSLDIRL